MPLIDKWRSIQNLYTQIREEILRIFFKNRGLITKTNMLSGYYFHVIPGL